MEFRVVISSKCGHCCVYNENGFEFAYLDSINEVFDFFYRWSVSLGNKSVTYRSTKGNHVLFVEVK